MELRAGSSRCMCDTCKLYFSSTSAFDRHRVGKHEPYERRCLTPAEMTKRGMVERGGVWGKAGPAKGHWAKAETVEEDV